MSAVSGAGPAAANSARFLRAVTGSVRSAGGNNGMNASSSGSMLALVFSRSLTTTSPFDDLSCVGSVLRGEATAHRRKRRFSSVLRTWRKRQVSLQGGHERVGLQEALLPRECHGLGAVVGAEFAEDGREMRTNSSLGDEETTCDLTVREALRYQPQHLRLPRAEDAVAVVRGGLCATHAGFGRFV